MRGWFISPSWCLRCVGLALVVGTAGACSSETTAGPVDASPPADARAADAANAGVRPAREVVTSGGRLRGGTYTFDVQIGHGVTQGKATAGSTRIEGAAAVKP